MPMPRSRALASYRGQRSPHPYDEPVDRVAAAGVSVTVPRRSAPGRTVRRPGGTHADPVTTVARSVRPAGRLGWEAFVLRVLRMCAGAGNLPFGGVFPTGR